MINLSQLPSLCVSRYDADLIVVGSETALEIVRQALGIVQGIRDGKRYTTTPDGVVVEVEKEKPYRAPAVSIY
jgi:hypothetical protein